MAGQARAAVAADALPTFRYTGASANLHFYSGDDCGFVEVLVHDVVKVDGQYQVRRPALFNVRVYRRAGAEPGGQGAGGGRRKQGGKGGQVESICEPRTPVAGNTLSPRTVTRLVRAHLADRATTNITVGATARATARATASHTPRPDAGEGSR